MLTPPMLASGSRHAPGWASGSSILSCCVGCQDGELLAARIISYYIKCVNADETLNGVPVTEEQIAAWAAEAEAGYDVNKLKERRRGRPGRGAQPSQVVALRLTPEELAAIDEKAVRENKSRSEAIREALASYVA